MKPKITAEEFERIVTAYLGGQLREGEVPIGVELAMAPELQGAEKRFEAKGFALIVDQHEEEESLVVLKLKPIATPAPSPVPEPAPAAAETAKEG